MNKKADANMWWIIIGAVIALVVMIILMVMFSTRTNKLEVGVSGCESKGGVCVTSGANSACPKNSLMTTAFDCSEGNQCCLGSPKVCNADAECGGDSKCTISFKDKKYCS